MIITRTPFRVSFAGGGSDIAPFYSKHGGCVLSTTINKYMYISVHPNFNHNQIILKYSKTEMVDNFNQIEHVYFHQILKNFGIKGIEIVSTADIPAGTGLGSSSSFTVGLLHALYCYQGKYVSKERLASEACAIEIEQLGNPIGKQDQYAASYGGLNYIEFRKDGSVIVEPLLLSSDDTKKLEDNLMLFYTGKLHSASNILKEQTVNMNNQDREQNMIKICDLARQLRFELSSGNIDALGHILHENWNLKKTMATSISDTEIDRIYDTALLNGALGGKLLGAGGGGFLLCYVPKNKQQQVRNALSIPQMPFSFDKQGTAIIYVGEKPDFVWS